MSKICVACGSEIKAEKPSYPVTCPKCGITYGEGGEVQNHRPGSESCNQHKLAAMVQAAVEQPK